MGCARRAPARRGPRAHRNANFAKTYVTDQLSQQNISFKTVDKLTDEEKAKPCLVEYAGQPLTTGKQAECYANEFIGLHLKSSAGGKTYAEIGDRPERAARPGRRSPEGRRRQPAPTCRSSSTDVTAQRETLFKGETLRGLLLTSYGFSVFGVKAGQAATVAYLGAALLPLLAIAGLVHAYVTPKTKGFATPDPIPFREKVKA